MFNKVSSLNKKKILIYRLGSLGDTLVALPALYLIARAFPEAERRVLTNLPAGSREAPLSAILSGSGLVHGYISYPLGLRNLQRLNYLRCRIKWWKPDMLIYLAEPRGRIKALRDALFFRSCGIKVLIGVPYTKTLQENKWMEDKCCYEHEAARLVRCLVSIGGARLDDPKNWDLRLKVHEQKRVNQVLRSFNLNPPFIACSVGSKIDVKNWGQKNWQSFLRQLSHKYKNYGLVLIGSKEEFEYSERVSDHWNGRRMNLCGLLTPRESAALLKMAKIFVGHDSGPTHLAASTGIPCVAIFSARNKPGVWFPYGSRHTVIYHQTDCYGCGLNVCNREKKRCITSISPEEVLEKVSYLL